MDQMNHEFQALLESKRFDMKAIEEEEQWIYQGKLSISDVHVVSFSVSLSKGDVYSVGQIIYQNIAYIRDSDSRQQWLELINELNRTYGIFYYFCIDEKDMLFARYVGEVSKDLDYFYHILVQGPHLIKQILPQLEDKFGKFVILR